MLMGLTGILLVVSLLLFFTGRTGAWGRDVGSAMALSMVALVLAALLGGWSSVRRVPDNRLGVETARKAVLERELLSSGWHLVQPWVYVVSYTTEVQKVSEPVYGPDGTERFGEVTVEYAYALFQDPRPMLKYEQPGGWNLSGYQVSLIVDDYADDNRPVVPDVATVSELEVIWQKWTDALRERLEAEVPAEITIVSVSVKAKNKTEFEISAGGGS